MPIQKKNLLEIKAQEEQIEMERLAKQREREIAYREKRKAKNSLKPVEKSSRQRYALTVKKEFVPTSNRQIFCSKDCCYQARQDQKKADRGSRKEEIIIIVSVSVLCVAVPFTGLCHTVSRNSVPRNVKSKTTTRNLWNFITRSKRRNQNAKIYYRRKNWYPVMNSSEIITIPA